MRSTSYAKIQMQASSRAPNVLRIAMHTESGVLRRLDSVAHRQRAGVVGCAPWCRSIRRNRGSFCGKMPRCGLGGHCGYHRTGTQARPDDSERRGEAGMNGAASLTRNDAAQLPEWQAPPIIDHKHYDAPSVFTPESLLREARRQKGLPIEPVPAICVFDPDGDLLDYLRATGRA